MDMWTDQRSEEDGSVRSEWLHERRSAPLLHVAVVQRQAAEVPIELQCHGVPAAVTDPTARDAQHVGAVAHSTAKATGQLEPQLPVLQLNTHTHTQTRGVKHMVRRPKLARWWVQSGPLNEF